MPAAPSTMPEELPAWWTWLIFSTSGYFCSATALKPGIISPCILNEGSSEASDCIVVCGRMCSSWSSSSTPF